MSHLRGGQLWGQHQYQHQGSGGKTTLMSTMTSTSRMSHLEGGQFWHQHKGYPIWRKTILNSTSKSIMSGKSHLWGLLYNLLIFYVLYCSLRTSLATVDWIFCWNNPTRSAIWTVRWKERRPVNNSKRGVEPMNQSQQQQQQQLCTAIKLPWSREFMKTVK